MWTQNDLLEFLKDALGWSLPLIAGCVGWALKSIAKHDQALAVHRTQIQQLEERVRTYELNSHSVQLQLMNLTVVIAKLEERLKTLVECMERNNESD